MNKQNLKNDCPAVGGDRANPDLLRDVCMPDEQPRSPIAKRILMLRILHPECLSFRAGDLDSMSESTLKLLLNDLEEALGID